jgi:hypothetical protein
MEPPQTIILVPVHTAVGLPALANGSPIVLVAVHVSVAGS